METHSELTGCGEDPPIVVTVPGPKAGLLGAALTPVSGSAILSVATVDGLAAPHTSGASKYVFGGAGHVHETHMLALHAVFPVGSASGACAPDAERKELFPGEKG